MFCFVLQQPQSPLLSQAKQESVRRAHSFDLRTRFGVRPAANRDSSGYLEPLLCNGVDHKYLELVDNATNAARVGEPCVSCAKVGCAGDCGARSRIARHSSDCTHKLLSTKPTAVPTRLVVQLPTSSKQRKQAARAGSGKSSSSTSVSGANADQSKKEKKKKSKGLMYSSVPQQATDNNNDVKMTSPPRAHAKKHLANGAVTSQDASNGVRRSQSLTPNGNQQAPADVARSHSNPRTNNVKIPNGRKVLPTPREYQNVPTFEDAEAMTQHNGNLANGRAYKDGK